MAGRKKVARRQYRLPPDREEIETTEEAEPEEEEEAEEEAEEESEEEEAEEELPSLTPAERRALFDDYKSARDILQELEASIEDARKDLQEAVKLIYERAGRGPYLSDGRRLLAVKRKPSKKSKVATYFFKEIKLDDIVEI